jgi:hypothetical protein
LKLKLEVLRATGSGTLLIEIAALDALIGSYAEPRLRLHLDDPVQIKAGSLQTKALIPGHKPEPTRVPVEGSITSSGWIVRGSALATALQSIAAYRDPDSGRFALECVALVFPEEAEGRLTLVTTDGHRIGRYTIPVKAHPEGATPERLVRQPKGEDKGLPLLSYKGLGVAQKLARLAGETSIALCVVRGVAQDLEKPKTTPALLQVVTKDAVLTTEVPDARFPRYEDQFADEEPQATITLPEPGRLATLVNQAVAYTGSDRKGLELVAAGGCIMLSMESTTKGKVQLSLGEVEMTGRFTIDLDATYLKQVLDSVGDDALEIRYFGPGKPLRFQCGAWFDHVLMPLTRDTPRPKAEPEVESGAAPAPLGEEAPPKKPRRGKKPKDGKDDGGSAPVDPTPTPEPLTPVAVVPGGHETNGHAKPRPRPRGKTS